EASVTNSLALAALAILAIRPGDLLDPGFQLSFAATAGILAAPMPRGVIAGAIAVSAAAQLAVLPITLTHFNQLSTIGVVVNLGVVPLAGVATVAGHGRPDAARRRRARGGTEPHRASRARVHEQHAAVGRLDDDRVALADVEDDDAQAAVGGPEQRPHRHGDGEH